MLQSNLKKKNLQNQTLHRLKIVSDLVGTCLKAVHLFALLPVGSDQGVGTEDLL